eukprot:1673256-Rhodomonas_salina.1
MDIKKLQINGEVQTGLTCPDPILAQIQVLKHPGSTVAQLQYQRSYCATGRGGSTLPALTQYCSKSAGPFLSNPIRA